MKNFIIYQKFQKYIIKKYLYNIILKETMVLMK